MRKAALVLAVVVLVLLGGLVFRMDERPMPEAAQRPMDETSATTASPTAAGSLPAGDARADIVARVRGMSGEIRPQFARGQTFSWGVYVIDAQTGDINGLNAGGENWPPYFDALPDQKP